MNKTKKLNVTKRMIKATQIICVFDLIMFNNKAPDYN